MIRVDFHLHTNYSKDSLSDPERLLQEAHNKGLNKLVITDHNTIRGARILQADHPQEVIIGEEILTTQGEILAFFVSEEIPRGLEPIEVFKRLKGQGAFISLSHPFALARHGWTEAQMLDYLPYLDAIEIANARNARWMNQAAAAFADQNSLCGTAGSDGHGLPELGQMGLELPDFADAEELRTAIRQSSVFGTESSVFVHHYSRKAVLIKGLRRLFDRF